MKKNNNVAQEIWKINFQTYKDQIDQDSQLIRQWNKEISEKYAIAKINEVRDDYECLKYLLTKLPIKYSKSAYPFLQSIVPNNAIEREFVLSIYKRVIWNDSILNWSQENIPESYVLQKFQEAKNDYQCLKFLWGHVPVKYDQMFFDRLKQIVPNDSVEQDRLQSILPVWQKVDDILAQ